MSGRFAVDAARIHEIYEETERDEMPSIWPEQPARDIDDLIVDLIESGGIVEPAGWRLWLYPLHSSSDPDMLLVAIHETDKQEGRSTGRFFFAQEWDDYMPSGFEIGFAGTALWVETIIEIAENIIAEANALLDATEGVTT